MCSHRCHASNSSNNNTAIPDDHGDGQVSNTYIFPSLAVPFFFSPSSATTNFPKLTRSPLYGKKGRKIGDHITNTACSSQASIPMFNHSNGNPFLLGALSGSPATTAPNGDHLLSSPSLFKNHPDSTETFSAKRKRLQSKPCKVYHVTTNTPSTLPAFVNSITGSGYHNETTGAISLPLSRDTTEGRPPFCATKQTKDNKSPITADHNKNCNSATSAAFFNSSILPSSNSIFEEPGAFSIFPGATNSFCHSYDTNLLLNFDRGGSRYLSQADHVGTDVSSDVGSHVNRDWLTRRFHPPDQTVVHQLSSKVSPTPTKPTTGRC